MSILASISEARYVTVILSQAMDTAQVNLLVFSETQIIAAAAKLLFVYYQLSSTGISLLRKKLINQVMNSKYMGQRYLFNSCRLSNVYKW